MWQVYVCCCSTSARVLLLYVSAALGVCCTCTRIQVISTYISHLRVGFMECICLSSTLYVSASSRLCLVSASLARYTSLPSRVGFRYACRKQVV